MAVLLSTDFTGLANGAAWPAPWARIGSAQGTTTLDVQSTAGRCYVGGTGNYSDSMSWGPTTLSVPADFELTMKLRWSADSFPHVQFRAQSGATPPAAYYDLLFDWDSLRLIREAANGTYTDLGKQTRSWSATTWYRLRLRVEGTKLYARVWVDGQTEPSAWDLTATDATYASGSLLFQYKGGQAKTGFTVTYDDIVLSDLGTTPAPTPVSVSGSQAPKATDANGTANDVVTLTKITGVTWTVDGVDHTSASFTGSTKVVPYTKGVNTTVTAKAESGYTLSGGTTSWTLTFTNYVPPTPTSVPAGSAPVAVDADGTSADLVRLTAVPGVIWTVDGKDYATTQDVPYAKGVDLVVTARAASGYTLSGTTSWTLTFTNYVPPPDPDPESDPEPEPMMRNAAVMPELPWEPPIARDRNMMYAAFRLNGDGTETLVIASLPLTDVSITPAPLNNAPTLTWSLEPEWLSAKDETGAPILLPWSTAIYAIDADGVLRGAGIIKSLIAQGSSLRGTMVGWTEYIAGMPWTSATVKRYDADPGGLVKLIWDDVQKQPRGNVGLVVPTVKTPVKVGVRVTKTTDQPKPTSSTKTTTDAKTIKTVKTEVKKTLYADKNIVVTTTTTTTKVRATGATTVVRKRVTKTTSKDLNQTTVTETLGPDGNATSRTSTTTKLSAGTSVQLLETTVESDEPWVLANYATEDLKQVVDQLLTDGSIDFREQHRLVGDKVTHELVLGYPRLGRRRTDIAFDLQVNVTELPEFDADAEDYASEVLVLGAGDGEKTVRASARNTAASRLRRVKVLKAKGIGRTQTAQNYATKQAGAYDSTPYDVTQLQIVDHPLAPMLSWEHGDEVRLTGDGMWAGTVDMWVRVIATTYNPEQPGYATLEVVRAG